MSKHYQYIAKLYCKEDASEKKIVKAITKNADIEMQVSAVEGKLIYILLKMIGAKKVIELGALGGYSASWIAKALPKDEILYSIEKSPKNIAIAEKCLSTAKYKNKIKFIEGRALDILKELKDEAPFDAIFIDADKESYPLYFEQAKLLLRSGGILIADNTFLFDLMLSDQPPIHNPHLWKAMRDFNEQIANDPAFDAIIIPTIEGLTLAVKK